MGTNVYVKSGYVKDILPLQTGTPTGSWMFKDAPNTAFQVVADTSATVVIEGSNDGVNAIATALGTITLAAAGSEGLISTAPWKYVRARVTANGGKVSVNMCN